MTSGGPVREPRRRAPARRAGRRRLARRTPIRVQVSDPVTARRPLRRRSAAADGPPTRTRTWTTRSPASASSSRSRSSGRPGRWTDDEEARLPPAALQDGREALDHRPAAPGAGRGSTSPPSRRARSRRRPASPSRRPPRPAAPPRASRRGATTTSGPTSSSTGWRSAAWPRSSRRSGTGVEGFEKVVAVKRILPHLSDNKEFLDMFVDEAKMVAGLTHPNIVADLRPRPDREELLHRDGVRARPRPAHDHEARAGEGPADAPRPEPARREPGLRRARVRPPQEGRARAADGDRAPRRQPAEHPHLVRGRGEARRLRHRQGGDQGLEHRPRGAAGQAPLHEPGAGVGPADRPPQRRVLARHRALRDGDRDEALHRRRAPS